MSKTKDRVTQVKLVTPCSHTRTGFVCVVNVPNVGSVPCTGEIYEICWIRSDLAKVGKRVRIEDVDLLDNVWTVAEVYGTKEVADLDGQRHAWREFGRKLGY